MHTSLAMKEPTVWQQISSWLASKFDDQQPKGAIAALDGVRAMAFLIVLILHMRLMTAQLNLWNPYSKPWLDAFTRAGFSGVTLFFVLSGFLLFLPYSQALLFQKSWPATKVYYMRRVLRILPVYFFAIFILVMLQNPYLIDPHNWAKLFPFLTMTMDFSNSQPIDGPLWTLAVEFQYYLILPFIALSIYGLTRVVRVERAGQRIWVVVGALLALIVLELVVRYCGDYLTGHPHATFVVSRAVLNGIFAALYGEKGKFIEDFAVGMLIAVCYVFVMHAPNQATSLRVMQRLSPWFGGLSVLLFVLCAMQSNPVTASYTGPIQRLFQIASWTMDFSFALSYGCCVMAVLFNRPGGWFRRIFAWTPLRWLGLLTFSLYIWHVPFITIIKGNLGSSLFLMNHVVAFCLCWVLVLGIAIPFSFAMYLMIEKPGMRLSSALRQKMLEQATLRKMENAVNPASNEKTDHLLLPNAEGPDLTR